MADGLESQPLEDRAGHRAALGDQRRGAVRHRVVPAGTRTSARYAPRPRVRASVARPRRGEGHAGSAPPSPYTRAWPSSHTACRRIGDSRHRLSSSARASSISSGDDSNASHCTSHAATKSSNVSMRRATAFGGPGGGSSVRMSATAWGPCRTSRPALGQRVDESRRRAAADFPLRLRAPTLAQGQRAPPRARRRRRRRGSAAVARCSTTRRRPCRACTARCRSARRRARAARTNSDIRRPRAAREDGNTYARTLT